MTLPASHIGRRTHWLPALLTVLFASLVAIASPARAGDSPDAEVFVDRIAKETIQILSNKSYTTPDKEAAFRVLFVKNADVPRIAIFALGQFARLPSADQKSEYVKLVEDFIVKVYVTRLSEYDNQTFEVLGSRAKGSAGKEVVVQSRINYTDGREPIPVEWWLLNTPQGFRIFDVKVVGIWLAQEQRSSFTSVIRNNGNRFEALLEHLRDQVQHAASQKDSTQAGTASGTVN